MKASEFVSAYQDYEYNCLRSDLNMGVSFGCNCGCGGDSYTDESWQAMIEAYEEHEAQFKEVCEQIGLEWDYD